MATGAQTGTGRGRHICHLHGDRHQVGSGGIRSPYPQPGDRPDPWRWRFLVLREILRRPAVAGAPLRCARRDCPRAPPGVFALHALLIKRHAISPTPSSKDPAGGEIASEENGPFTHHLRRIGAFALVLLSFVGALAVLLPPGVGPTPVEGIEVTRPLWMSWWYLPMESRWGAKAILWASGALFIILALVPFVDRTENRWWRSRPVAMVARCSTGRRHYAHGHDSAHTPGRPPVMPPPRRIRSRPSPWCPGAGYGGRCRRRPASLTVLQRSARRSPRTKNVHR